jgi:hypothetical protein
MQAVMVCPFATCIEPKKPRLAIGDHNPTGYSWSSPYKGNSHSDVTAQAPSDDSASPLQDDAYWDADAAATFATNSGHEEDDSDPCPDLGSSDSDSSDCSSSGDNGDSGRDSSDCDSADGSDSSNSDDDSCSDDEEDREFDIEQSSLFIDDIDDKILLYSGGLVTVKDLAQVLESLQTHGALSDTIMQKFVAVIRAILPSGHNLTDHQALRAMLASSLPKVERIHACSNHCVLFYEENESLLACPECGSLRYSTSMDGKTRQPVNVFRTVPLDKQIRAVFSTAKSAQEMRLDPACCINAISDSVDIADITESIGFREKVVESKFLTDTRNPILMMATDGVNPNGRKSRAHKVSMWPHMVTFANKHRSIRHKRQNVILMGLVAGHVLVDGKKKYGTPKSLNAYNKFYLNAISKLNGVVVRDASYPEGDPKATFTLSVMLLGTITDLDGLYKLLNMVGAGGKRCCPKCTIRGKFHRHLFLSLLLCSLAAIILTMYVTVRVC